MNSKLTLFFLSIFALILTNCSEDQTASDNPAASNSRYPFLYSNSDSVYMSWITQHKDDTFSLNFASYKNQTWSKSNTIAQDSSWFVNWADYPSIIADQNGPLAAHWLKKRPGGTYAYDVAISTVGSKKSWSQPLTPHFDSTATEHGFVSIIPWNKDTILAVWLDGRETANRSDEEYYNLDYAMTLRGALIGVDGIVKQRFLIDDSVCDCCQTSLIKTTNGAMVAYRNRTNNEIRDIYVSRFTGSQWTEPQVVYNDNWKIGGCPVNGPKLASADSMIVANWYTAAKDTPITKASISTDDGKSFNTPIVISKQSAGRVDAAIHNGKAYISWIEKADKKAEIRLTSIDGEQSLSTPIVVDKIDGSRKSGFPQMEVLGDKLIFAWTHIDGDTTSIKTKEMELPLSH